MKRTIYLATVIAMAACFLTTGCKKEDNGRVFRLEIQQYNGAAKTSLDVDNNATLWTAGDIIYINGTDATHQATVSSDFTATLDDAVTAVNGKYYAFYAGNATNVTFDETTNSFTYQMPTQYEYDPNILNAPMAGVCDDNNYTISFTNICAMLKLTFVLPPDEVYIHSSSKLSGTFTTTYSATDGWVSTHTGTLIDDDFEYTLTIFNQAAKSHVLYVPIPAGTHQLTIDWNQGGRVGPLPAHMYTQRMNYPANLLASHIYPKTCAYAFTVSEGGAKIYFAPGNLQYLGASTEGEWKFATNQWDILSADQCNSTNRHLEYVDRDLFEHATSNLSYNGIGPFTPWGSYTNETLRAAGNTSNTQLDWGHNTITNGDNLTWRTPTEAEWSYLLAHGTGTPKMPTNTRLGSGFGQAKVHGQNGLIIFPDGFECPDDVPVSIGWRGATDNSTNWPTLDNDQWEFLEANGCVFLPATGYATNGGTVTGRNTQICYVSGTCATTGGTPHKVLYAYGTTLNPSYNNNANDRGAVRLVRDVTDVVF